MMRLVDLLTVIGMDSESDEKIQICHPGEDWDEYDTFYVGSKLLKPFYDFKIKALSAIETDVFRVDLDFGKEGGGVDGN